MDNQTDVRFIIKRNIPDIIPTPLPIYCSEPTFRQSFRGGIRHGIFRTA